MNISPAASRRPSPATRFTGFLAFVLLVLAPVLARAELVITGPLTVIETGGTAVSGNLAPSGTAFALDEIGVAPHAIADVNDGAYGNASSWIGATPNSFIGISLGATPVLLDRVAFGRDNTGALQDRTTGLYTLQYTTVPNPSAATPEGDWTTLGTLDYPPADPETFPTPWLRRAFQFTQVSATGFRIKVANAGIAIDEIELYSPPNGLVVTGRGLALVAEGGAQRSAHNLALASAGATPFAKDSLPNPAHALANLNDGAFGNASSWIAGSADTFLGVSLGAEPVSVARVAFGRDNTGVLSDRALGLYTLQYTTVPTPGAATPDSAWITLGTLDYQRAGGINFAQPALRHEFAFPAVEATGLRLRVVTSADVFTQVCIDEFEVYGPPRLRVAQPANTPRALVNRVAMWGTNHYGQLNVPANLPPPSFFEVGFEHVATLDAAGAYRGWSTTKPSLAIDPAASTGLRAVGTGYTHNLVIRADGTVAGWGGNGYGQTTSPAALVGKKVRAVGGGSDLSVALTDTGEVVAWGYNFSGQANVPAGLTGVRAIDVGENFVLALKNDGTVVAWGYNAVGPPNIPAGLSGVRAIAAGYFHALALKEDGTVVAWGINNSGQTNVPAGLANVKAIAAGWAHSAALLEDDSIVFWGDNTSGQLTPSSALADRVALRKLSLGRFVSGALYATPAPYIFGIVAPGSQSTRTFTVTNDGGTPLALGAPSLVGGDAARFSLDVSALPASLAPGQSATFDVTFTPTDAAAVSARLIIPTDDPATPAFVFALGANQTDTTAPVITPPANIALTAAGGAGAAASFTYTVTDNLDPLPAVVVSHPSGTVFPIGATTVTITATDSYGNVSTATFVVTVSAPPMVLAETAGTFAPNNLAPSGTAFALNDIGAPHTIGAVNDGIYGNASSWIAGTVNSFVGINLGATPVPVRAIAFGRDNTGVQTTRSAGTYTVQFTTTPNPGAATPDSAWFTLGSITLPGAIPSPTRRHLFSFLPVEATGIRLRVIGAPFEIGIDEIELYDYIPSPTLVVEQPAGSALVAGSSTIDFGAHEAGQTVPPRVVTLRNTGSSTLVLTTTPNLLGTGATNYATNTVTTSLNVAPGATTTFGLSFFATGFGTRPATLRVATNDPATPAFDVALAGEVLDTVAPLIAPYADVAASSSDAAGIVVNFAAPTVTDASGLAVTVVFSPASGSLFPIGTTPVTVTATDVAGNSSSRNFQVQVEGRSRASFELAGAQPVPGTPPTLDFGEVALGTGATRSLLVRNTGLAPLTVTGATLTGAQASEFGGEPTGLPFTLAVGESRALNLTFNPSAHGARSAALVLATTGPAAADYTLALSGSGLDTTPPVLGSLPDITATTSSASGLRVLFPAPTVTDNGSAPVTLTYSAASGSLFPLGSTPVTVTATDAGGNAATSSFAVEVVAGTYPPVVPVNGTVPANLALARPVFAKDEIGVAPHATAKINDRTYGNASSWIGASLESFVGVNLGSAPVAINRVAFSRDHAGAFVERVNGTYIVQYTTVPNPGASTPEGSWITLGAVTYPGSLATPQRRHLYGFAEVLATGLRLVTQGIGEPVAIDELEIHGPAGELSVTDASANPVVSGAAAPDFGTRELGTTSPARVFTLGNPGTHPLVLDTVSLVGADPADFVLTPSTALSNPIPAGGSATLQVAFRPTVLGPRQAVLRIASAAAGSPFDISLGGTGVDSTPPQITPPADRVVVVTDLSLTGATVSYPAATVTDNSGQPATVAYSHPSGGFFPRGLTTITITATDASGNSSTATFGVAVLERAPLALEAPAGNLLTVGRSLRQWGVNNYPAPTHLTNVVDVALGDKWGMALLDDGTVTTWYDPQFAAPQVAQVPSGLSSVVAIGAGDNYALAVKANGTVVGWGQQFVPPPAELNNAVAAGSNIYYSFALKSDGSLAHWKTYSFNNPPAVSSDITPAVALSVGPFHILTLLSSGGVAAWGDHNLYGEASVPPAAQSGVKQISAGYYFSLAVKNNGTVVGWGADSYGAINGLSGLTNIVQASAGKQISLVLRADGTVVGAGADNFAALTAAQGLDEVVRLGSMRSSQAAAVVRAWPELAVGTAALTASATRTLTVRNTGLTPLRVTGLSFTGPDAASFSVNGAGVASPIPPGGTANVLIIFTAQGAVGLKRATLRVDSDDPIEPFWKVRLTGEAADVAPPVLGALPDIDAITDSATGRPVTFAPSATDDSGLAPTITTNPASGAFFPIGDTPVQVTATDASGNTATGSFTVTVIRDQTPPVLTVPASLTAYASATGGVSVLFAPTATDDYDPSPVVTTTPASGAVFPLGQTPVTVTATDAFGNVSTVNFTVTVVAATDLPDVTVGGAVPANLATGKTAFAKDGISDGTHAISNLNDGAYGNASSWIASSLQSFAGINLGSTPVLLDRVAFGRDHTGAFVDRAEGEYVVQYTTAPNPDAATPDSAWLTLGTVQNPGTLEYPARRNLFAFAPVAATGVRIRASTSAAAVCIDEIELYAPAFAPTPSELWRDLHFGTISNSGNAADNADPDRDGIVNLLEYAFGRDPNSAAQNATPAAQVSGGYLEIRFTPPSGVTDIIYGAQSSTTLAAGSWQTVPDTGTAPERLFRVPISGQPRTFLRLVVTRPAP